MRPQQTSWELVNIGEHYLGPPNRDLIDNKPERFGYRKDMARFVFQNTVLSARPPLPVIPKTSLLSLGQVLTVIQFTFKKKKKEALVACSGGRREAPPALTMA